METAFRSELHPDDFALLERVLAREEGPAHCAECDDRQRVLERTIAPSAGLPVGVTEFRLRSQVKRVRERLAATPRRSAPRASLLFRFAGAAAAAAAIVVASLSIETKVVAVGDSQSVLSAASRPTAGVDATDDQLLRDIDSMLSSSPLDGYTDSESTSDSRGSSGGA